MLQITNKISTQWHLRAKGPSRTISTFEGGVLFKGVWMAQSSGDGKLLRTGPYYHDNYTTKFSQGSDTYVMGGLSLAVA